MTESPPALSARSLAQIYGSALFVTLSELALKTGADRAAAVHRDNAPSVLASLASPWVWAGIVLGLLSMVGWLAALRRVPLSIAFVHSNIVHVSVPVCCWLFLGESISTQRWLGIAFVLAGITCIARPLAKIEDAR